MKIEHKSNAKHLGAGLGDSERWENMLERKLGIVHTEHTFPELSELFYTQ